MDLPTATTRHSQLSQWPIFSLIESTYAQSVRIALVFGPTGSEGLLVTHDDDAFALGSNTNSCLGVGDSRASLQLRRVDQLCKKGEIMGEGVGLKGGRGGAGGRKEEGWRAIKCILKFAKRHCGAVFFLIPRKCGHLFICILCGREKRPEDWFIWGGSVGLQNLLVQVFHAHIRICTPFFHMDAVNNLYYIKDRQTGNGTVISVAMVTLLLQ